MYILHLQVDDETYTEAKRKAQDAGMTIRSFWVKGARLLCDLPGIVPPAKPKKSAQEIRES